MAVRVWKDMSWAFLFDSDILQLSLLFQLDACSPTFFLYSFILSLVLLVQMFSDLCVTFAINYVSTMHVILQCSKWNYSNTSSVIYAF